jgi:hypothetical protein
MKHVRLTLTAARLTWRTDSTFELDCLECGTELDVHQPDLEQPDRLLGTCEACGAWYLLTCLPAQGEVHLLALPTDSALDRAVARLEIESPADD